MSSAISSLTTETLAPMQGQEERYAEFGTEKRNIIKVTSKYQYIEWEKGDTYHPFNWTLSKRWKNTFIALTFNSMTAMNATGYSAGKIQGSLSLNTSQEIWMTGTTAYLVPVAITPLILSPLSEIYGRKPLYTIALFIYMMMYIPQGLAPNMAAILCSRVVQGCAGSVGNTMVAGSIADMFPKESRSLPMSVFVCCVFLSQGISSMASAWTVANANLSWRWIFWWQGAITLAAFTIIVLFLDESRASVLLSKRAFQLAKGSGIPYRTEQQDETSSFFIMASRNLSRPIKFFVTEPIVAFLALWIGFLWGVVFLSLEGVGVAFQDAYGWSDAQTGTVLLTIGVGGIIGFLSNFHQNHLYQKARKLGGGEREAEARLYWAMPATTFTAGGLFWYGWGAQSYIHPAVPILGLILFSWGTYVIYLATLNYIADSYETFASSGVACQALLRNILGGCFPLFAQGMYHNLTPPVASSVLGALAAVLGAAPFILFFYGPVLRKHSQVLSQLAGKEEV